MLFTNEEDEQLSMMVGAVVTNVACFDYLHTFSQIKRDITH